MDIKKKNDDMSRRKTDHIDLAFKAKVNAHSLDRRFHYEPLLSGHPVNRNLACEFLGKQMSYPIWISSMTGGTERAKVINENLARLCGEYGLAMGLGSCRPLLKDHSRFSDFNMRPILGKSVPFFANLGIAQLETLIDEGKLAEIDKLIDLVDADGIIIHVNPLQEWAQPEGDFIKRPPIESIEALLDHTDSKVIAKEVGQGMGPKSLDALMKTAVSAIEFGAGGGTNFTKLELDRSPNSESHKEPMGRVGHTADEMVEFVNEIILKTPSSKKEIIISGGVQDYLHGYYLIEKCQCPSIYGQASAFLKPALESYEALESFLLAQIDGLRMAHSYLHTIKK